jgi:hypothetical protein
VLGTWGNVADIVLLSCANPSADGAGPFVPSYCAQPFLERLKVNFRVAATETGNIRLEAGLIEPAEHLIELFAEEKPHHRHGKLLEFHRPAPTVRGSANRPMGGALDSLTGKSGKDAGRQVPEKIGRDGQI